MANNWLIFILKNVKLTDREDIKIKPESGIIKITGYLPGGCLKSLTWLCGIVLIFTTKEH